MSWHFVLNWLGPGHTGQWLIRCRGRAASSNQLQTRMWWYRIPPRPHLPCTCRRQTNWQSGCRPTIYRDWKSLLAAWRQPNDMFGPVSIWETFWACWWSKASFNHCFQWSIANYRNPGSRPCSGSRLNLLYLRIPCSFRRGTPSQSRSPSHYPGQSGLPMSTCLPQDWRTGRCPPRKDRDCSLRRNSLLLAIQRASWLPIRQSYSPRAIFRRKNLDTW